MKVIFEAKTAKELFAQILDFTQGYIKPPAVDRPMNATPAVSMSPPPITIPVKEPFEGDTDGPDEDEEIDPVTGAPIRKKKPRGRAVRKANVLSKGEVLPEPALDDKNTLPISTLKKVEGPKLTKDDTLNALKSLTAKKGMDVGKKLLVEFKAVRVSDIKPELFQDFIDACTELENGPHTSEDPLS